MQDFLRTLQTKLADAAQEVQATKVYLYAPEYVLKKIEEHLPQAIREKIITRFPGNFTQEKPQQLLEMIAEEMSATHGRLNVPPTSPEAQKILDTGDMDVS